MAIEYQQLLENVKRQREAQMMPMFEMEQMSAMGILDIVALQFLPGAADNPDEWKVFVEFREGGQKGYCYYTNNAERQEVFLGALEEVEPPLEPMEVAIVNLRVVRVRTPFKRGGYYDFASGSQPVKGGRKSVHTPETGATPGSPGSGASVPDQEEAGAAQRDPEANHGGVRSHLAGLSSSPIPASAAQ